MKIVTLEAHENGKFVLRSDTHTITLPKRDYTKSYDHIATIKVNNHPTHDESMCEECSTLWGDASEELIYAVERILFELHLSEKQP